MNSCSYFEKRERFTLCAQRTFGLHFAGLSFIQNIRPTHKGGGI